MGLKVLDLVVSLPNATLDTSSFSALCYNCGSGLLNGGGRTELFRTVRTQAETFKTLAALLLYMSVSNSLFQDIEIGSWLAALKAEGWVVCGFIHISEKSMACL